jgi:two-component sensor histidine kinase
MEERRPSVDTGPRSHASADVLEIGSGPTEARRARDFAERVVGDGNIGPERRDLVLMAVSELVTNAVVHGSPPRRLTMARHGYDVDVAVQDGSRSFPRLRDAGVETPGGHGLRVVDRIADGWGVRPIAQGKEVWCRIRLDGWP